ncbi:gp39 [Corynebacterium phage BFK20]|uniref:Gp39 n=1 Tax=Corynebacterium phage BFK20 TaxID=28358 RepID=Q3V5F6_9CAUD|nr:gp39 [Corynebacterium phage BFK20]CAJ29722.1 gp39 [Corynebacterium phage BFK20]
MSTPNPFQGQQYGAPQGQPNQFQQQAPQGNPFQSQPQPNQFQPQAPQEQPNQFQQQAPQEQPNQFQPQAPQEQPNQFQGQPQAPQEQPNQFQGQPQAPQEQPNQFQPQAPQEQPNQFQQQAPQEQPNQFQQQAPQEQPNQFQQQQAPAAPQQQFTGGNAPAGNLAEMFNQGTTGGGDKLFEQANLARAVIVRPLSYEAAVPTSKGNTDAVRAEWIFLDEFQQTGQAVTYTGLIFQKVPKQSLHGALQSPQPKPTLGVIAMGEGRNGNNAPWLLNPAEEHTNTAIQAVTAAGWM